MPALLTHYCLALEVFGEDADEAAFVGSQGPDPFFFYGRLPWKKREDSKTVPSFGTLLHRIDPADFYAKLLMRAAKSEDRAILKPYLEGLFLHYCLDRRAHPFIFYKSGQSTDPSKSHLYSISHMYYETFVDVLVARRYDLKKNPDECLELSEDKALAISRLFMETEEEAKIAGDLPLDAFSGGVKDYKTLERFLLSRHGIKKALITKVFGPASEPSALSYPSSVEKIPHIDFLNESHGLWRDPVSGEEHHTDFYELMKEAELDYASFKEAIDKAYEGEDVTSLLKGLTKGLNHDGTSEGALKTHFDLVWKVE